MNYKESNYALNKFSEGFVYPSLTDETIVVTYEDAKKENPNLTFEQFQEFKEFSDEDYKERYNSNHKETRRSKPFDDLMDMERYATKSPEHIIILKELRAKVNKAIKSLTETQQRRVRLYYFDGLTEEQIAKIEGVSQQNISKSIALAKEKLKLFLK